MAVLASNPNNPVVFFDVTIGGQVGEGAAPAPAAVRRGRGLRRGLQGSAESGGG